MATQTSFLFRGSVDGKENRKAEVEVVRQRLARMEQYTVNPNGLFLKRWDIIMILSLAWTAIMTPFEVSFITDLSPTSAGAWVRFGLNRVIDLIFFIDIILTFLVPYRKSAKEGSHWVYDNWFIARRYLKSWFVLDALSAVPIDVVLVFVGNELTPFIAKLLKTVRVLKLLRLVRLGAVMKRWLSRTTLNPSAIELIKFAIVTLFTAHTLACLWGFVGNYYSDNSPINIDMWYVEDYNKLSWVQKHQMTGAQPLQLYGVAFYVSLANILGGPTDVSPANYVEYFVQAVMMLIGSSLWAYIIGAGCSILSSLNPAADEHRRSIGLLNQYCAKHNVPKDLSWRLRSYLNETSNLRYFSSSSEELLMSMTPTLRGEASLAAAVALFERVPYLSLRNGFDPAFLSHAALAIDHSIYCPREEVPSTCLTIVVRGLIARHGKCGIGVFGTDMIINAKGLRDLEPAMALTLVHVNRLTRESLDEILAQDQFPIAKAVVRRARIKLTFIRVVLATARVARSSSRKRNPLTMTAAFDVVKSSLGFRAEDTFIVKKPLDVRIEEVDHHVQALGKALHQCMDGRYASLAEPSMPPSSRPVAGAGPSVPRQVLQAKTAAGSGAHTPEEQGLTASLALRIDEVDTNVRVLGTALHERMDGLGDTLQQALTRLNDVVVGIEQGRVRQRPRKNVFPAGQATKSSPPGRIRGDETISGQEALPDVDHADPVSATSLGRSSILGTSPPRVRRTANLSFESQSAATGIGSCSTDTGSHARVPGGASSLGRAGSMRQRQNYIGPNPSRPPPSAPPSPPTSATGVSSSYSCSRHASSRHSQFWLRRRSP